MGNGITILGKIIYLSLEGGFWGIESSDGKKYFPIEGLPPSFQKENIQIRAIVTPSSEFNPYMWGRAVEVKEIEKVSD
jgi:hypothetical protein